MDVITPKTYTLVEHMDSDHARTVLVDWMLGNLCSYACSYCPKNLHDGSVRWQKVEDALDLFQKLRGHYAEMRGKKVWIQFTGGEPTMHPHIIQLLQGASEHGFSVSLISNASRTIRFWHKIKTYLDSAILTYHNEFAEIEHFCKVGQILTELMPVHINVTMHPDRFDRTYDEACLLRETLPQATISLKPLRIGFRSELYDYDPGQLEKMRAGLPLLENSGGVTPRAVMTVTEPNGTRRNMRANEFVIRGENQWRGYRCNAGVESLRVKGDGSITRAVCAVGGKIGKLGGDVALPFGPIVCTAATCACVADILITKAQPGAINGAV